MPNQMFIPINNIVASMLVLHLYILIKRLNLIANILRAIFCALCIFYVTDMTFNHDIMLV